MMEYQKEATTGLSFTAPESNENHQTATVVR